MGNTMRPLADWTEADLTKLVDDDVQESITLDYKRSTALDRSNACRNEISKDVSAFANSAGGRIVYGIEEVDNRPVKVDGGCDPAVITREWLEQVINSQIQPRVQDVYIKPISLASGGAAYVVDITPATFLAPHQALDKKYYRRFNFQSVPMEDYEIKDAMRRATTGEPVALFSWARDSQWDGSGVRARLQAVLTNLSPEPVLYAACQLRLDERLVPDVTRVKDFTIRRDAWIEYGGARLKAVQLSLNIMQPNHMPLFREQKWLAVDLSVPVPEEGQYYLGYRISCPGNEVTRGGFVKIREFEMEPTSDEASTLLLIGP